MKVVPHIKFKGLCLILQYSYSKPSGNLHEQLCLCLVPFLKLFRSLETILYLMMSSNYLEKATATQCSCLENPRDGGAWWAAVYGVKRVGHDWSDLAAAAPITHSYIDTTEKTNCNLDFYLISLSIDPVISDSNISAAVGGFWEK